MGPSKARIIRIGNSRGVRLPKTLLEAAGLGARRSSSESSPAVSYSGPARKAREGWAEAARRWRRAATTRRFSWTTLGGLISTGMNGAGKPRSGMRRFEVVLVRLDPVEGSEIAKTRPCTVVSPDELAEVLRTVLVAPMTTAPRAYPFRVPCRFRGRDGFIAIDQIRRHRQEPGRPPARAPSAPVTRSRLLETLQEFFAP